MSKLVFKLLIGPIKSLTPDGSSSSLSITDVFSAEYDVYFVTYFITTDSGSPKDVHLRFINSIRSGK